jgi:hypothetical protein
MLLRRCFRQSEADPESRPEQEDYQKQEGQTTPH